MINLVYASSALKLFSEQELVDLLNKSREKNHRLNITGMLLYNDGNFLQVLEGEDAAVRSLYQTILDDPRHHMITTITTRIVKQRNFPEWEMGFVNLHKLKSMEVPGFSDYLTRPLNSEHYTQNPSIAYAFLQAFKESAMRYQVNV